MFCSQCAHSLTPSDVYCPNCAKPVASFNFEAGQIPQVESLDQETPTVVRPIAIQPIERRSTLGRNVAFGILGGVLLILALAIVGFVAYRAGLHSRDTSNVPSTPLPVNGTPRPSPTIATTPTPRPELPKNLIVNSVFTVDAGDIQSFEFSVEKDAKVTGGFRTTDGGSKDIDTYIVDERNIDLAMQKEPFQAIYTRLKAERGKIDVTVTPGRYFIIFSNRHALLTRKEVAAEVYYQEVEDDRR